MKKILLPFLFLTFFVSYIALSQGLKLQSVDGTKLFANRDTLEVFGYADDDEMLANLAVNNTNSLAVNVKIIRKQIDTIAGTSNIFCWSMCYGPKIDTSSTSVLIPASSINKTDFQAHYMPKGKLGSSIIKYRFYNKENLADSVVIFVKYTTTPVSIAESNFVVSNIYPNPTSSVMNFDYNFNSASSAQLIITNLLGSEVYNSDIATNNNKMQVNLSNFEAGVYFYTILVNDKAIATKKLVVRK